MQISAKIYGELVQDSKINRNTGLEYTTDFDKRCSSNKICKILSKLNDDELLMFYKIIINDKGTFRNALNLYFKSLGVKKDLPKFKIVDECIKRNNLEIK